MSTAVNWIRQRSLIQKIGIGATSILFLCFLCSVPAAILGSGAAPTVEVTVQVEPTGQPTEAPTSTSAPTDTSEPTETSTAAPTDTPEPTNTPEPTATVEPTPTKDAEAEREQEYREFVSKTASQYSEGFGVLSEQNTNLSQDLSLILDDRWILQTASSIVVVQLTSQEIIEREDVPQRFSSFHQQYVEAAHLYNEATELYVEGIDNFDIGKLERASELMNQAVRIINELPLENIID